MDINLQRYKIIPYERILQHCPSQKIFLIDIKVLSRSLNKTNFKRPSSYTVLILGCQSPFFSGVYLSLTNFSDNYSNILFHPPSNFAEPYSCFIQANNTTLSNSLN